MQALWMIVASAFYALYAVCTKFSSGFGLNSFEILMYRSLVGMACVYFVMRLQKMPLSTQHPIAHMERSVVGTLAVLGSIFSISHLNIGLAMTLNYTSPIFIGLAVIVASFWQREKVNWKLMATIFLGFVGVVILMEPTFNQNEYLAAIVGLGTGAVIAGTGGLMRKLGRLKEPILRTIFYFSLAGAVVGFGGAISAGFSSLTAWSALTLFLVGFTGILGQYFVTKAFGSGNIVLCGALQFSVVPFSTIVGEIVFDEPATWSVMIGMAIIIVSGILASVFTKRAEKQKAQKVSTKLPNPAFEGEAKSV